MERSLLTSFPVPPQEKAPLVISDIPVPQGTGPYLITTTRKLLWLGDSSKSSTLQVGVRKRLGLEEALINSVIEESRKLQWGSIYSLTLDGISKAQSYVTYHTDSPVETICSPATYELKKEAFSKLNIVREEWVPEGSVIVVPEDRSLLGTVWEFTGGLAGAVVHNARRGVGIAC